MRSDSSPRAVSMMMGSAAVRLSARSALQTSRPLRPGSIKSRMTRSGGVSLASGSARPPSRHDLGAVTGLLEIMRDERGDVVVVFDDEDARHVIRGSGGVIVRPTKSEQRFIVAQKCAESLWAQGPFCRNGT